MGIKPIDLQTNMSHLSDVGKSEQIRNEALLQQQSVLGHESNEKSRLVNTKLEEAKKGEGSGIRDKEEGAGQGPPGKRGQGRKREERETRKPGTRFKDDRLGNIIDVFK
ncbi:MAG: hypothetical protein JXA20_03265 [Spirochaetes bacterium]|nr:hypothetical protein [Spirochaetota bacterium]